MVVHACNPRMQEAKEHKDFEFQVSLGYIVSHLRREKKKNYP
jgi:hypothetical protein